MSENRSKFLRHIQVDLKGELMEQDRQTNDESWRDQPKGIIEETVEALGMFWLLKNQTAIKPNTSPSPRRAKIQQPLKREQKTLQEFLFDLSYDEHRTVVHHQVPDGCLEECLEKLLKWEQFTYGDEEQQGNPQTPILDLQNPFFYSNNSSLETYVHEQPIFEQQEPRCPYLDKFIKTIEFPLY